MSAASLGGEQAYPRRLERATPHGYMASAGLTKRELFALVAMHAELMTCGVPGEACDDLIEAANNARKAPEDQMALNACLAADALLAALCGANPKQGD